MHTPRVTELTRHGNTNCGKRDPRTKTADKNRRAARKFKATMNGGSNAR